MFLKWPILRKMLNYSSRINPVVDLVLTMLLWGQWWYCNDVLMIVDVMFMMIWWKCFNDVYDLNMYYMLCEGHELVILNYEVDDDFDVVLLKCCCAEC